MEDFLDKIQNNINSLQNAYGEKKERYQKEGERFKELAKTRDIPKWHMHDWFDGVQIRFKDIEGDAICNSCTYTNEAENQSLWETYRFPWDNGDVTVMTTEELLDKLEELQKKRREEDDLKEEEEETPKTN